MTPPDESQSLRLIAAQAVACRHAQGAYYAARARGAQDGAARLIAAKSAEKRLDALLMQWIEASGREVKDGVVSERRTATVPA